MKVIIPRGGSGAGKSTWIERTHPEALIFSADAFFINEEGVYGFDVTKLGEAHAWCFKSFINCCQSLVDDGEGVEDTVAVVDNPTLRLPWRSDTSFRSSPSSTTRSRLSSATPTGLR